MCIHVYDRRNYARGIRGLYVGNRMKIFFIEMILVGSVFVPRLTMYGLLRIGGPFPPFGPHKTILPSAISDVG